MLDSMNMISFLFKKYFKASFFAFALLVMLVPACASVPVQEMSNARQALEAARQAGAETGASKELQSAEILLNSAEQALQEGDYKQARKDAEASRDQSVKAQDKLLNE